MLLLVAVIDCLLIHIGGVQGLCGGETHWVERLDCPFICDNGNPIRKPCPPGEPYGGCQCIAEKPLSANGICMSIEECLNSTSPPNHCDWENNELKQSNVRCDTGCSKGQLVETDCNNRYNGPRCICAPGYVRLNGKCVTSDKCTAARG